MYTLYASLRSPFARRIRVLLQELDIQHEVKFFDVFQPTQELLELNPLARVPVLKCPDGFTIIDSNEMVQYFSEKYSSHPIFQKHGMSVSKWHRISGLTTGAMELTVQYFLNGTRAVSSDKSEFREEAYQGIVRACQELNQLCQSPYVLGNHFTYLDVQVGVLADYVGLRVSKELIESAPNLALVSRRVSERPSFQSSVPPK